MCEKLIVRFKYRKKANPIPSDSLPVLRHVPKEMLPVEAYINEAGKVTRGEKELMYIDMRVYLKEGVIR